MSYIESGKKVLKKLIESGFEAYFIGGMVRDYLLDGSIHDIDITTSAKPEEIINLFDKTIPAGIKFGMVIVIMDDMNFEVTTFRKDGEYLDNRHPEAVLYSNSLIEDTKRRDFTINSMALDINMKLFDFHNGLDSLNNKIIKAIGNPMDRFQEDALRILRAIYFVSKLGFDIDNETQQAMKELSINLKTISIERVYQEMKKIMNGKYILKALTYVTKLNIDIPDLRSGIDYLVENKKECNIDELFVLSYKLNEEVSELWKISNSLKTKYNNAMVLATCCEDGMYNSLHVYSNKAEVCLLANSVNVLMGFENKEELICEIDKKLPIHKTCDLVFKGQDVMAMTPKEPDEWLGDLIDDIKFLVINGDLANSYIDIKEYVINRFEKEGVPYEK